MRTYLEEDRARSPLRRGLLQFWSCVRNGMFMYGIGSGVPLWGGGTLVQCATLWEGLLLVSSSLGECLSGRCSGLWVYFFVV